MTVVFFQNEKPFMLIQYKTKQCHTRSTGLIEFLNVLVDAYPSALDFKGIQTYFPCINPRQVARYVDKLEGDRMFIIDYRTKTCGPFRLSVSPKEIQLPRIVRLQVENPLSGLSKPKKLDSDNLETLLSPQWIPWVENLTQANLCLNNSYLGVNCDPFLFLDSADRAAKKLPDWAQLVVNICRAHIFERKSLYSKARSALRCLNSAKNEGQIPDNILVRGRLCEAKILYDQGRYQASEEILDQLPESIKYTPPLWFNIQALNSGQKFLQSTADPGQQRLLLSETLSALMLAFSDVFLMHGDSSLLDALSFNIGNNLLRGIRKGVLPTPYVSTVLEWFFLSIFIGRELGTGSHSVLTQLLIIDVLEEFEPQTEGLPAQLEKLSSSKLERENYLKIQLKRAEQSGHRGEIAECLLRLAKITEDNALSMSYFKKARDGVLKIQHKALLTEIDLALDIRKKTNNETAN
ncbi:hypothetical protein [Undibacterium fentianense]|uniref:Uncharacterized protein n=1 Tax=Undibacterium fentianense TaxID=2828728 RepID=A0A941IBW6_9BURK|nr:hypothetical protein [Undibacterium fentianense]MBR7799534.1 hypothetical protein [Undibacterium fentianense]